MAEHEFDVVVVGSGAAGMTAALAAAHHGLSVVVVEKADVFGGSTARSGGGLWLPGNEVLRRAGVVGDAEAAPAHPAPLARPGRPAARPGGLPPHPPARPAPVPARPPPPVARGARPP